MHKLILALVSALTLVTGPALAAGGGVPWDRFPQERMNDMAALQNGAKLFANYCLSCHGAEFVRYNRLRDIGLTEEQIETNLILTGAKVGETMKVPLDPKQAKEWFGAQPPDMSVIARSRSAPGQGSGADYLYTYLRSYYRDPNTATGWNNLVFPAVGMPHVLWQLQGERRPVFEVRQEHGHEAQVFTGRWEQVSPGTMTPEAYDSAVADLVGFLQWMSEPVAQFRVRLGVWVMIFLAVFTVIAWRLNAVYWKDIK
ncbi:MAG: cytochrome c1 [Burkholderiales bacterium]|nr:cytochrome c1 [Burkholderiales bacterium]